MVDAEGPADEDCKDVYAHFGLAYYRSEVLHRGAANLYAIFPFTRGDARRPALEERLRWAVEASLQAVFDELKPVLPGMAEEFRRVSSLRNYLAHRFWYERIYLMTSRSGCFALVEELEKASEAFHEVDLILEAEAERARERIGFTPEQFAECLEECLRGEPEEPLPDRRPPRSRERLTHAWWTDKRTLVLRSEDGHLWQLGDHGLIWYYGDGPGADWMPFESMQMLLPSPIESRVEGARAWNYRLFLLVGAFLTVERDERTRRVIVSVTRRNGRTDRPNG